MNGEVNESLMGYPFIIDPIGNKKTFHKIHEFSRKSGQNSRLFVNFVDKMRKVRNYQLANDDLRSMLDHILKPSRE
jgi:hypothetical protein